MSGPVQRTASASAAATEALGAALARRLRPGDVVLLHGEMGAGKTTFVRGALRALGVRGRVTSPTFTLGRRYPDAVPPASHLDLHRLARIDGEDHGLLADYVDEASVAFVEWPEAAEAELGPRVVARVRLAHAGADRREIVLEGPAAC